VVEVRRLLLCRGLGGLVVGLAWICMVYSGWYLASTGSHANLSFSTARAQYPATSVGLETVF